MTTELCSFDVTIGGERLHVHKVYLSDHFTPVKYSGLWYGVDGKTGGREYTVSAEIVRKAIAQAGGILAECLETMAGLVLIILTAWAVWIVTP